jgi:hypothetical protein
MWAGERDGAARLAAKLRADLDDLAELKARLLDTHAAPPPPPTAAAAAAGAPEPPVAADE